MRASSLSCWALGAGIVAGALGGCSPKKAENKAVTQAPPPAAVPAAPSVIDTGAAMGAPALDSANLSAKFVRGLRELTGGKDYRVRGKYLILGRQDSVAFPTALPAGRPVIYTGQRGDQTATLTVTRLNYTSIEFVAELAGDEHKAQRVEAVADLNPGFYLGAEAPEDSQSQTAFGAAEFVAETPQGNFSVQIGLDKDADKATLFAYDATGKPLPKWRNMPTLWRLAL
ncbi:hypothetical protein [Hymenobacter persicinus]|uniref:Lipoprotein n=1 Tax=Hymenobacter persicinus TaxID=2025506 RepID=A0A4Q5LD60_9BACT|nr:hypothetical protein [Hymenobacter persicinus]RYU78180.1 hypothetical protein EWM57_15180 [Hymenobacter persicinus]